jgi:glycosyltransferase involved in cell wall biosynthesis
MSKKTQVKLKNNKQSLPFVSICTPTFNRRPFIPIMFEIFKNQDYPKNRLEWIIVDDGTDPIEDLVISSGISQIKYFRVNEKMSLGKKRNYMHSLCSSDSKYICYADDDDYFPYNRISHSIELLEKNPNALIAASSELYVYFKHIDKIYQFGPYNQNHGTAGTFCFRKKMLDITRYNENAELAEEKEFLQNYSIPMIQLDPLKTILVVSHNHNTFDKKILLENPHPQFCKESNKTLEMFFRKNNATDQKIKRFFLDEIDDLLKNYEPGEPKHKPKVLKQMAELKQQREEMQHQQQMHTQPQLMIERPGFPPTAVSLEEVVNILQNQQQQIEFLTKHSKELEDKCQMLQFKLIQQAKLSNK